MNSVPGQQLLHLSISVFIPKTDPPQLTSEDPITSFQGRDSLDVFFRPASVAVIGATDKPGHVGRAILWNLISSCFGGTVYPVNPKRSAVLGVRAYRSIADVPEQVDLAVVVTPAESVLAVIQDCSSCGVHGTVIISAGFSEIGERGAELERQVLLAARRTKMRVMQSLLEQHGFRFQDASREGLLRGRLTL